MKPSFIQVWAWSLGLLLLHPSPVYAQATPPATSQPSVSVSTPEQKNLTPGTVLQQLGRSKVVYLGETHDSSEDHRAQLEIIRALHRQNPKIAIAMEMFQRPYQSVIDRYLAGTITEAQLKAQTEYQKRWGFPWEYYAPILRFAKENRLPVIALNTPSEVTRKVSRRGLNSLTAEERRWIPPFPEIRKEPARYRERLQQAYGEIHHGRSQSDRFESFFLAQVLWDETMSDAIHQVLQSAPDRQVIVLAGQGHLIYGDGIPSRVARRGRVNQSIVLLNPPKEFQTANPPAANYFWKTPLISE